MKNELYDKALNFVVENGGAKFSKQAVQKYLVPEKHKEKPASINRLYQSLIESAQNLQMSPNVIESSGDTLLNSTVPGTVPGTPYLIRINSKVVRESVKA